MSNPMKDYVANFRANLPSGVTYDSAIARYFVNNKRFLNEWEVERYLNYITKFGFSAIPASIFANGENGSLLEAPTLDTLYTDDAGTTEATVGDPFAVWSDGSGNGNDATQTTAANRMVVSGTGPYYLNPDAVNDNFEIPLGAGFTGDFCLILDTGPIFGSIDTGVNTTWNYTVTPAYIPDGNVHALIVVDRAFTSAEKQGLVDHYAGAVTSVPSTARNAFRDRTDLTALDASYGDWTGVTDAGFAFFGCSSLTTPPDVSGWTQVTNALFAFFGCSSLTTPPDVSGWTQVTNAGYAFRNCSSLTTPPDVSGWTQVTNARSAFQSCSGLTTPPDVSGWTQVTNAFAAFYKCSSLTTPPDVSGWTQVTNAGYAFYNCSGLTTPPDVSGWTQVTNAGYAFQNCYGLTTPPDVSGWTQVTNASRVFQDCSSLTTPPDVSGWTQVTSATEAFYNCSGLTTPPDVSGWTQVTDAAVAFYNCSGLTTPPDVSGWTQVTNARSAFLDCSGLTTPPDVSGWTQVTNARDAFRNCYSLTTPPDVSGWTQVTNAAVAFYNCSSLTSAVNLDNWNPTILTDGENMMSGISAAGFDQTAYDSALTAWDIAYDLTTVNTIDIHFGSAQYGSGAPKTARDTLAANGWTITDAGEAV